MAVDVSPDCLRIVAATAVGTIGMMEVTSHMYRNLVTSHTASIADVAMDPHNREFSTVSEDNSVRIWDLDTFDQLYEFDATASAPTSVAYHPSQYSLACGFQDGYLRIFDVGTTAVIEEYSKQPNSKSPLAHTHPTHLHGSARRYRQHEAAIMSVQFTLDGRRLFSAGADSLIVGYDVIRGYQPIKVPSVRTSIHLSIRPYVRAAVCACVHWAKGIGLGGVAEHANGERL